MSTRRHRLRILVVDDNRGRGRQPGHDAQDHGQRHAHGPRRPEARGSGGGVPARRDPARHRHAETERLRGGRRIRQQPWGSNVFLVAQTGWGQEDDSRRSKEAGFDVHMVKPVDPAALEKLLAELQAATA